MHGGSASNCSGYGLVIDGECRCIAGYGGDACDHEQNDESSQVPLSVVIAVAGVAAVLACVATAATMLWRRAWLAVRHARSSQELLSSEQCRRGLTVVGMLSTTEKQNISNECDEEWAEHAGLVNRVEPKDLKLVKLLGRGAFAEVYEAEVCAADGTAIGAQGWARQEGRRGP